MHDSVIRPGGGAGAGLPRGDSRRPAEGEEVGAGRCRRALFRLDMVLPPGGRFPAGRPGPGGGGGGAGGRGGAWPRGWGGPPRGGGSRAAPRGGGGGGGGGGVTRWGLCR